MGVWLGGRGIVGGRVGGGGIGEVLLWGEGRRGGVGGGWVSGGFWALFPFPPPHLTRPSIY